MEKNLVISVYLPYTIECDDRVEIYISKRAKKVNKSMIDNVRSHYDTELNDNINKFGSNWAKHWTEFLWIMFIFYVMLDEINDSERLAFEVRK